mgnify:CR=1 FL=1|jgi:hypothetical protein
MTLKGNLNGLISKQAQNKIFPPVSIKFMPPIVTVPLQKERFYNPGNRVFLFSSVGISGIRCEFIVHKFFKENNHR